MDTKTRSIYILSTRVPLHTSRHIWTESERVEKYIPSKWEAKESWGSNPYIRQIDLRIEKITKDKEGHYIMIKGSIQVEDITIVNIYIPDIAPQYIRQTLTEIKGEIDSNIILLGDFSTPLTPMDRSSKQKINKETQILNDTLDDDDDDDDDDIFRTFHPNAEEYTFFSNAHGTFFRIDPILGHKSKLSKFKKIEIISSIFSDYNAMRLDINYRGKKL